MCVVVFNCVSCVAIVCVCGLILCLVIVRVFEYFDACAFVGVSVYSESVIIQCVFVFRLCFYC